MLWFLQVIRHQRGGVPFQKLYDASSCEFSQRISSVCSSTQFSISAVLSRGKGSLETGRECVEFKRTFDNFDAGSSLCASEKS